MADKNTDYLLGANDYELNRLHFQHMVWKEITDDFFDKMNVQKGWKILDVGAGPGFVAFDLMERVGTEGEITALEPSEFFLDHFKRYSEEKGWKNTKAIHGDAETAKLPENYYDVIFARWVIGFVPDPELFISKLMKALKPGGIIALQDYAFDRLLLYPQGGDYDKLSPYAEAYWKYNGGDLKIAVRIPSIFKKLGLKLEMYHPNSLAGSPESTIFAWHHEFITHHIPLMVEKGIMPEDIGKAILADWNAHRANPDAVYFSPMVVDMAGVK